MTTITSVSGGQTSGFLAANYPSDHLLFALVRIEDPECRYPDEKLRRLVEDRIQKPFIGTVEDDTIIHTMLDLEQYLGKPIQWLSGRTYDAVIKEIGYSKYLPNKVKRFCTTFLKIEPMFYWWLANIGEPVIMQIGYRATEREIRRANKMNEKVDKNGLLSFGDRGWIDLNGKKTSKPMPWQRPDFPLIRDGVLKYDIQNYWSGKPVRFAPFNNCVGCFHRSPLFLAKMYDQHPNKMDWFAKQEDGRNGVGTWKDGILYRDIKKLTIQRQLSFDDLGDCESGYCEAF